MVSPRIAIDPATMEIVLSHTTWRVEDDGAILVLSSLTNMMRRLLFQHSTHWIDFASSTDGGMSRPTWPPDVLDLVWGRSISAHRRWKYGVNSSNIEKIDRIDRCRLKESGLPSAPSTDSRSGVKSLRLICGETRLRWSVVRATLVRPGRSCA